METPTKNKLFLLLIFILECFALPVQFYLLQNNPEFTFLEALVRFFSFFTILTNTLVTVCCGFLLFGQNHKTSVFFQKNTTLTAITVYIVIVGAVYNIFLRPLEDLSGLYRINTEIFHSIVPLLFLLYWTFIVPKQNIPLKAVSLWLIYPILYELYTIFHGNYTGFYPYPFIDVNTLGFAKAMQNGIFILIAFVLLSFVLIGIGKMIRPNKVDY